MPYKDKEKERAFQRRYCESPRGRAKHMVYHFRWADKKAGRGECTITEDWIMENIFTSKCHYCGETDWHKLSCDRIDNSLPHTPENVVCCCESCNKKRGNIPFKIFLERLKDGEPLLKKNRPDISKPCVALNDAGEVVYEFPSVKEAVRMGFNLGGVAAACRGCFGRKKNSHRYKGLLWFYK